MDAFARIIGQERAIARLRLMLEHGTVPHAVAFTGPRGLGKGTLAMTLAAVLLGGRPETHPDFRSVGRERDAKTGKLKKNISVEAVRELRAFLRMTPLAGQRKVAVIDEAETLSDEAGNALLKTLEEPAGSAHILLIAHDASALLPTVRSRAAIVPLAPAGDEAIAAALGERGMTPQDAASAAIFADGRPGLALSFLDETDMLEWYRAEDRRWRAVLEAPPYRRISLVSDLASGVDREEAAIRLKTVLAFWESRLRREASAGRAGRAAGILRSLIRLRRSLGANVQPKLLLERFVLEFDSPYQYA